MHKARTVASIVEDVNTNGIHEAFGSVESAARNGWYDYFCDETMLKHRTKKFLPILNGISGEGKVRADSRVTFKNACGQRLFDLMTLKTGAISLHIENFPERNGAQWLVTTYREEGIQEGEECKFNDTGTLTTWLNTPWEQVGDEDAGSRLKAPDSKSTPLEEMLEVIEEILHGDYWVSDRQREILGNVMMFIDSRISN